VELKTYMKLALQEAVLSLREGNNGFGAVIIQNKKIISTAHDTEDSQNDPLAHAELKAIKVATEKLGKNLTGCILVSTHEPCPMCATAIIWSGISEIVYGYSIKDALAQGRRRIDLSCRELFERAKASIKITEDILSDECSMLYQKDVRAEIKRLINVNDDILYELNQDSIKRRTKWFEENRKQFNFIDQQDILTSAYKLLLTRFGITEEQAPIIKQSDKEIVFHSKHAKFWDLIHVLYVKR